MSPIPRLMGNAQNRRPGNPENKGRSNLAHQYTSNVSGAQTTGPQTALQRLVPGYQSALMPESNVNAGLAQGRHLERLARVQAGQGRGQDFQLPQSALGSLLQNQEMQENALADYAATNAIPQDPSQDPNRSMTVAEMKNRDANRQFSMTPGGEQMLNRFQQLAQNRPSAIYGSRELTDTDRRVMGLGEYQNRSGLSAGDSVAASQRIQDNIYASQRDTGLVQRAMDTAAKRGRLSAVARQELATSGLNSAVSGKKDVLAEVAKWQRNQKGDRPSAVYARKGLDGQYSTTVREAALKSSLARAEGLAAINQEERDVIESVGLPLTPVPASEYAAMRQRPDFMSYVAGLDAVAKADLARTLAKKMTEDLHILGDDFTVDSMFDLVSTDKNEVVISAAEEAETSNLGDDETAVKWLDTLLTDLVDKPAKRRKDRKSESSRQMLYMRSM